MGDQVKKTPVVLVLGAWLFVGVPWGWGVVQLWKNATKLFQSTGGNSAGCSGKSGSDNSGGSGRGSSRPCRIANC